MLTDYRARIVRLIIFGGNWRLAILGASVLIGYWRDLWDILNLAIASDVVQYILIVPFAFLFLLYRRRKFLSLPFRGSFMNETIGIALCLLSFLLYVLGSFSFDPLLYHLLSLPIFFSGAILIVYGFDTLRALAFPIALLFFLAPFPLVFLAPLGGYLSGLTAQTCYTIFSSLGFPVSLSSELGFRLDLTKSSGDCIAFLIDLPCSGIYSLLGFTFFAVFFAYFTTGTTIRKLSFTTLGFVIAYLLNVVRIALMMFVGYAYGYGQAIKFYHLFSGSVILFLGILVLLAVGEKTLKVSLLKTKPITNCPHCSNYQDICHSCGRIFKWPVSKPRWSRAIPQSLLVLLISLMVTLSFGPLYFQAPTTEMQALTFYSTTAKEEELPLPAVDDWSPTFITRDRYAEDFLKIQLVNYFYYSHSETERVWGMIEVSDISLRLHLWETCLQFLPYGAYVKEKVDVRLFDDSPLTVRILDIDEPDQKRSSVYLYWFDVFPFKTEKRVENKHVKITLIAYPDDLHEAGFIKSLDDQANVHDQLLAIARKIEESWKPLREPQNLFAATILSNKEAFLASISGLLVASFVFHTIRQDAKAERLLLEYEELSDEERALLSRVGKDSTSMAQLHGDAPEEIQKDWMMLNHLEEAGFVKKIIIARGDRPFVSWKRSFLSSLQD